MPPDNTSLIDSISFQYFPAVLTYPMAINTRQLSHIVRSASWAAPRTGFHLLNIKDYIKKTQ